jgi:hypothetical protein
MDPFTQSRLKKCVLQHRQTHAQLPTLKDLENYGFSKKDVELAVKENCLVSLYVTLTNGAIVKVFKVRD